MSRSPATGGLLGAGARALGEDADAPDVGAATLSSGAEAVLRRAFVDALACSLGLAAAAAAGIFSIAMRRETKNEDDARWATPQVRGLVER